MKKIILIVIFLLVISFTSYSMTETQWNFAQHILEMAYEAKKVTGLPASIVSAQLILESGWGKHTPTDIYTGEPSNNYFGIKSDGSQPYVTCYTYEWVNGKYIEQLAKFRKYDTLLDSLIDYGNFIYENPRYWRAIAWRLDARRYILEIWRAGYATSPDYVEKVLRIAEMCKFLPKGDL